MSLDVKQQATSWTFQKFVDGSGQFLRPGHDARRRWALITHTV
jgi:hypothetical protein